MSTQYPTGLAFEDLGAWRAHERRRRRLVSAVRGLRARRREGPAAAVLHSPPKPNTLVVIDHLSASCRCAVEAPLAHLDPTATAILAVPAWVPTPGEPDAGETVRVPRAWRGTPSLPESIRSILTLGSFNPLAAAVTPWALEREIPVFVAQHGLLTRWAPPLVAGERLLSWSEKDARYWTRGREAPGAEVVGSQMLWAAGRTEAARLDDDCPVILGQLHGTELSRASLARGYIALARRTDAEYRPHPNESDITSRTIHRAMKRAGVSFSTSREPVSKLARPVISVFSTGTLEAAHRGLPAWVHHADPPHWVQDVWERYGLSPWGQEPTRPMPQPPSEPASIIARHLERAAGA